MGKEVIWHHSGFAFRQSLVRQCVERITTLQYYMEWRSLKFHTHYVPTTHWNLSQNLWFGKRNGPSVLWNGVIIEQD